MNQELMKEFKADLKEFREMTEKVLCKRSQCERIIKGSLAALEVMHKKVEKRACSACVCQAAE